MSTKKSNKFKNIQKCVSNTFGYNKILIFRVCQIQSEQYLFKNLRRHDFSIEITHLTCVFNQKRKRIINTKVQTSNFE